MSQAFRDQYDPALARARLRRASDRVHREVRVLTALTEITATHSYPPIWDGPGSVIRVPLAKYVDVRDDELPPFIQARRAR
jgi:hypothetical protein